MYSVCRSCATTGLLHVYETPDAAAMARCREEEREEPLATCRNHNSDGGPLAGQLLIPSATF